MPSNLREKAAALAAKKYRIKDPLVIASAEAGDAQSGKPVHRFKVVAAADANGPALSLFLNERGEEVEASDALRRLFDRNILGVAGAAAPPAVTIQPNTNVLTLSPGQTVDETITVTIPKNAGPARADV